MENITITDFLERGSQVKTQIGNSVFWIPNVVLSVEPDGEKVEIILDGRYDNFVVFEGDFIKLNYLKGNIQYFIETNVSNVKLGNLKSMILDVTSVKKIPNMRKYQRYSVNYGANIFSFEEPDGVFGVVTNISLGGLGFTTKSTFYIGQVVNVALLFPAASFCIDAEIVRYKRTHKNIEYGVQFVRQDEEAKKEINKVIEEIKEREDRLSHLVGFNI